MGVNTKYQRYHDKRTHTIFDGSNFVAAAGILGVNAMAEDIQRDPSQVELVKSRGQVLFCWTDDQNNPSIVQYLKGLGCDGIIYDRIDVNSSKEVKQSIFLMENEEDEDETSQPKCSCTPPRENVSRSLNFPPFFKKKIQTSTNRFFLLQQKSPEQKSSSPEHGEISEGIKEEEDVHDVQTRTFSGMFNKASVAI